MRHNYSPLRPLVEHTLFIVFWNGVREKEPLGVLTLSQVQESQGEGALCHSQSGRSAPSFAVRRSEALLISEAGIEPALLARTYFCYWVGSLS
ncbi:hypothetical protein TNIN_244561 [Trichonephila inaurata madagascariensis]|uniref:Uncharacterized protein n=1 Tax=Trichonephila inaurata madagascariensis TaxID=2747483 RepID=A0A8X6YFT1_9ARAC|nr:hypothetical protein TNIN_244561 [Trichonephila inaurata madagascariensis]